MITYIFIKIHCKCRVQIKDLQGVFTACPQCSRRPHSVATVRCLTRSYVYKTKEYSDMSLYMGRKIRS